MASSQHVTGPGPQTVIRLLFALIGHAVALIGLVLTFVGKALALVSDPLALVSEALALISEAVPFVRGSLALEQLDPQLFDLDHFLSMAPSASDIYGRTADPQLKIRPRRLTSGAAVDRGE